MTNAWIAPSFVDYAKMLPLVFNAKQASIWSIKNVKRFVEMEEDLI